MGRNTWIFAVGLTLSGCGVGWLDSIPEEQLLQYPDVIALAKDRYTSVRASGGMAQFREGYRGGRNTASFRILTNVYRVARSTEVFVSDMVGYCKANGGSLIDFSRQNEQARQELRQEFSKTVPKTNIDGSQFFECGPPGHGTVSSDWTRFTPDICRPLYTTVIDVDSVQRELGKPPLFACEKEEKYIFVGNVVQETDGEVVRLYVRLNTGALPSIGQKIDVY
jgi:hypothetical protein